MSPFDPAMDDVAYRVFRFDGFTLDVMRRAVRRGERDIELRPKSFDVLCCLVERAGQPVAKEEIIEAVWPNVVVGDESLARCVSDVRRALGDTDQRIIKTLPRRGYLFAAPVTKAITDAAVSSSGAPEQSGPSGPKSTLSHSARALPKKWLAWGGLSAATLLLVIGTGVWFWPRPSSVVFPGQPSIAVLAFANMSGDPREDYLSDGISEDVTTSLSKFTELLVIANESAFRFKERPPDVKRIGRELGVRYLVLGSTRRDTERIRVTAQLIEAASGARLWAEQYDIDRSGLFSVQDEIVQKIVATLVSRISKSELDRALRKPPQDLTAHDYYLRGNALMRDIPPGKNGEAIASARALYEQAIGADPYYAPAMQGLALTYFRAWMHRSPDHPIGNEFQRQDILDRAEALARKAVELDSSLAKGRATLGWILYWQQRPKEGLTEFERAFDSNSNFVDGRFGALLALNGRAPEAIEYLKRVMRLDPFYSPICIYYLGMAYFFAGRYEEANELIKSVSAQLADRRPAKVLLAAISAHLGHTEQALATAAEVLRTDPEFRIANWLKSLRIANKEYAERLAINLRKAGLPD